MIITMVMVMKTTMRMVMMIMIMMMMCIHSFIYLNNNYDDGEDTDELR